MVIVCGKEALDSERMGNLCREKPMDEVYALPWLSSKQELLTNLGSNSGKPNRLFPCENNTEPYEGEFQEFDEALQGDAFGRMADLVSRGSAIVNDVMTCRCESGFYGRVLSREAKEGAVFLVMANRVTEYFPSEPLSAKMYAATTVPTRMRNTDAFSVASGCGDDMVDVLVASDFIPGTATFMRFYQLMSGMSFVATINQSYFDGEMLSVFRHDKGYRNWSG